MLLKILIIRGDEMVNLVEQLYCGTIDFSLVNFDLKHFEDRSIQRNLPKSLIKNLMINNKMLHYRKSHGYKNGFELFYNHPHLKEHGKIKICVQIFDNCINVMTVYEEELTSSGSRRKSLRGQNNLNTFELQEKLLRNARCK